MCVLALLRGLHALCVLLQVSQWYELVVFTASMEIYGSAVADKLDNNRNILKRRYYRQVTLQVVLNALKCLLMSYWFSIFHLYPALYIGSR